MTRRFLSRVEGLSDRDGLSTGTALPSMRRMKTAKRDLLLAVTTYPDPKFMLQHLRTASYVK